MKRAATNQSAYTSDKPLYDVHCHIIDDDPTNYALVGQLQTQRLCLMGTRPSDWQKVSTMACNYPDKIRPAFGLHPWFAERDALPPLSSTSSSSSSPKAATETDNDPWWLASLRSFLTTFPHAIVGEIGLDKVAKDPETGLRYDTTLQLKAFDVQFELAAELNRPISLHCVQHQGSADTVKRLLRLEKQLIRKQRTVSTDDNASATTCFYFSISAVVNQHLVKKPHNDRLLLESDIHRVDQVDLLMDEVCLLVKELTDQPSIEAVKTNAWQNAITFFNESFLHDT
ncbi:hypothetical protein BDF19DRAFT_449636 [Syncephalis fuscata]|nr:hypothetical protein BDF19DRAFT_449636 [Syncephalis fuscata]